MKRYSKHITKWLWILLMAKSSVGMVLCQELNAENKNYKKNYLGTSVFVLSSLIPDDNTYFFELDYGYKINPKHDLVLGANIYQYTAPMSAPWKNPQDYPEPALSYGVVMAWQHAYYRNFFINQMVNPLIVTYGKVHVKGFMLLFATRTGYHFDFTMAQIPMYLEAGVEISYWPVNKNVPADFSGIDQKYKRYVFSPALQMGFRF